MGRLGRDGVLFLYSFRGVFGCFGFWLFCLITYLLNGGLIFGIFGIFEIWGGMVLLLFCTRTHLWDYFIDFYALNGVFPFYYFLFYFPLTKCFIYFSFCSFLHFHHHHYHQAIGWYSVRCFIFLLLYSFYLSVYVHFIFY